MVPTSKQFVNLSSHKETLSSVQSKEELGLEVKEEEEEEGRKEISWLRGGCDQTLNIMRGSLLPLRGRSSPHLSPSVFFSFSSQQPPPLFVMRQVNLT